jgi:hypothetical protein
MSNPEFSKHKVATDALENLGMLLPEGSKRDAIHLAVEPVVCGPRALMPGQRIKLVTLAGKPVASAAQVIHMSRLGEQIDDATGIVDPFLTARISPGQRFYLIILPRKITSLRHVWSHPDFPEEAPAAYNADVEDEHYFGDDPKERAKAMSMVWLKDVIANNETFHGMTAEDFIEAATAYLDSGEYFYGPSGNTFTGGEHLPAGFWEHYERITGRSFKPNDDSWDNGNFFACSC